MERMSHALIAGTHDDVRYTVVASEGLDELPEDVSAVRIRLPRRPAFLRIFWFYVRSGWVVRRWRREVDLVHSCGAITPARVDVATVHLCHAAVPDDARAAMTTLRRANARLARALGTWIERRQYQPSRTGELVAVSRSVDRELALHYPEMSRSLIHNGVDPQEFALARPTATAPSRLRALVVTGDFALKGLDLLLDALVLAPSVELTVAGQGPIEEYRQRALERVVADRVEFVGYVEFLNSLYAQSEVVVCASHYEAFGLFFIEGAMSGCAVVSTDVGVAREIVGDNEGGYIVESTAMAFATALEQLAANPADLAQRAAAARQRSREFTLDAMNQAYVNLYWQLERRGGRDVLHVGLESPTWRIGGLNRYLDELVAAQRTAGATAGVVWVSNDESGNAVAISPTWRWPRRLRAFSRAIRQSNARVIDVHFAAHAWWALRSGALRRRPLVVHFQGPWALESRVSGGGALANWVKSRLEGSVLRRADLVVTLSEAFRQIAMTRYRVAPHRLVVRAPGVTMPEVVDRAAARDLLHVNRDERIIVAVRRLERRMGLERTVELFAEIRASNERLVIVGEGSQREALEQAAERHGVNQHVTFAGRVDDAELDRWYAAADVSLVPSVALEGYGLVVLESIARGTPVIVSDVDGLRDASRQFRAVRSISWDAASLRAAIDEVTNDPSLRETARYEARDAAWSRVALDHLDLYDQLISGRVAQGVAVLDHTAQLSGGELALTRVASALDGARWRPHVILAEDGPLTSELLNRGISHEILAMGERTRSLSRNELSSGGLGAILETLAYGVRLRRLLRRRHLRLVHSNSMKAHLYGTLATMWSPRRFIVHVRDRWDPPYLTRRVARGLRAATWFAADRVIANSSMTAQSVHGPVTVLASPVEERFFVVPARVSGPVVHVAVIGRLAPWKGQDLAILAAARLKDRVPLQLSIVGSALFGEEEYEASLHELANTAGVADRVTFLGHVDDVAALLDEIDITILTSRAPEPFGNVVVEAMAAGRSVIVPDRGGVTEFVTEGLSGFFYAMGDVDDLVRVLSRVAVDEELRRFIGPRARDAVAPFRAEEIADQLEEIYDEVVTQ